MGKTAILLGGSGLTGSFVLQELLYSRHYDTVHCIGRRPLQSSHPKLKEHSVEMSQLDLELPHMAADVLFCCIGTTKAKTPDKRQYKHIDYGIPVAAAKWAKASGIGCFVVISSLGANADSPFFYTRLKGEMEVDIGKLAIPKTFILRPSIILGKRKENRFGERIAKVGMTLLSPFLFGALQKYKPIHAQSIAKAMLRLAEGDLDSGIIESHVISKIAEQWD